MQWGTTFKKSLFNVGYMVCFVTEGADFSQQNKKLQIILLIVGVNLCKNNFIYLGVFSHFFFSQRQKISTVICTQLFWVNEYFMFRKGRKQQSSTCRAYLFILIHNTQYLSPNNNRMILFSGNICASQKNMGAWKHLLSYFA